MKIYYHPYYAAAATVFATTRKASWVHADLCARPLPGVCWAEPEPVTPDQLLSVHTPEYVEAIRTGKPGRLAHSNGFTWDAGIWVATTRSTGGVVAAALEAWRTKANTGSLSSGLHHARGNRGAGFCTFNGLALAAREALAAGARRVLILDLDAHGGGGTFGIVSGDPRIVQLDIAVDAFDGYLPDGRSTYDHVQNADDYLPLLHRRLSVLADVEFDLCLYNAGVDPHQDDIVGGLPGMTAEHLRCRDEFVWRWFRYFKVPVCFVLAGGYPGEAHTEAAVVALHRQTVETALIGE